MVRICLSSAVLITWLAPGASGADVSGVILINKKIEKRNVAPAVYDLRGAAVPYKSAHEPRNEFDRIAVWLEPENGSAPASKPITATIEQRDRRFEPELLIVPVGSTVDLLVDASNPGAWMLHCHISEHLESGMMTVMHVDR